MRILLIDDDVVSNRDVAFCLQVRYPDSEIQVAQHGIDGIEFSKETSPDLIFLGSSLPKMTTIEIVKAIREKTNAALMILAENQTSIERAQELESGADDYIIKPCSPIELLAKVGALLRRVNGGSKPNYRISIGSELVIDLSMREVFISGKRLSLTPTEYLLLTELVKNEGKVLTNNTLLEKVWGDEYINDSTFIKKYIHRLRNKIEPDAKNPRMIINKRGIGYRFERLT